MPGKPPRHPGKKSRNVIEKERYLKEYGGLSNQGKPWTTDELDKLVTFLVTGAQGWKTFSASLGRTRKSTSTFGWKCIDRGNTKGYIPRCLVDREFKVWNENELKILRTCLKKLWDHKMIARATGRSESAVRGKIEELQLEARESFGFT
jgi:hypothetical protein